ncbi:MAG: LamG-like jellyroll fold domain-containing protein [Verrucomicrobiota bacterium JB023]|nr:LamG-like jellyroll fold domain-containing protein [Verrucomicrobiota bacterium JB023]
MKRPLASLLLAAIWGLPAFGDEGQLPVAEGLILDLNANQGVVTEDGDRVAVWRNQAPNRSAVDFVKQDRGRKLAGSGRPTLTKNLAALGGSNALVFAEQELVNHEEDAFDHLITGQGYTWFSVMAVHPQQVGKKDVNSFFGNLRNGPPYEGFWGNLMDDNRLWMGTRNGLKPEASEDAGNASSLWHAELNPLVVTNKPLETNRFYLLAGRMGSGLGRVSLELFVNDSTPVASETVPVNPEANPSKLAIGQERDAIEHPGKESFHGEIARFLIYERPLSDAEMQAMTRSLRESYNLRF